MTGLRPSLQTHAEARAPSRSLPSVAISAQSAFTNGLPFIRNDAAGSPEFGCVIFTRSVVFQSVAIVNVVESRWRSMASTRPA